MAILKLPQQHYIPTQAIFRRYQNSFCLFICICITAASAVFMFPTAVSNLGNKSTIRRLHTRIVLQSRETWGKGWHTDEASLCVHKLPEVSVQVFQHPVLVLNCLEYGLHHVRAVTVAMWWVGTCTGTCIKPLFTAIVAARSQLW